MNHEEVRNLLHELAEICYLVSSDIALGNTNRMLNNITCIFLNTNVLLDELRDIVREADRPHLEEIVNGTDIS